MNNTDAFDATQRVNLDADDHKSAHRPSSARPSTPRPTPSRRARERKRRQRNILIAACAAAVLILIGLVVLIVSLLSGPEEDDGLILDNVFAAGVNLGGMNVNDAKAALHAATDNTYTEYDMTISILDTTLVLSPENTGARLDVDAVVQAAYNYGRTGSNAEQERAREQAANTSCTISIVEYLNLDTNYIKSVLSGLGAQYSTLLTQSSYTLVGNRPDMDMDIKDTEIAYQTLTIRIGTAEYGLNTDTLYEQILDAYEINIFEVTANCTVVDPDPLDVEAIYAYCECIEPVNAEFNTETYEVTPEIYGYGFTLEQLQSAIDNADYGDTLTLKLYFIEPDITRSFYEDNLFQDTLATFTTTLSGSTAWNANVKQAAKMLNGTIIKAGEDFSFNAITGKPTTKTGFQAAYAYLGKSYQSFVGAGISQVASTLYCAALGAELDILERSSHSYTVDYIQAGFDAQVYFGSMDLKFTNNTENAIQILAEVVGHDLTITILGSDTRDYDTKLRFVIDETFAPSTVYNTMTEDNTGGYTAGTVLTQGITGYSISTYVVHTNKETGAKLEEILIGESYYAKRDQVVVSIYQPPVVVPEPTDPPETTDPTDPSETTTPTEPEETTAPTEPEETTAPTEGTENTQQDQPSEETT